MSKKKDDKRIIFVSETEMPPVAMSLGSMLYNKTGAWRNIKPVIKNHKHHDAKDSYQPAHQALTD